MLFIYRQTDSIELKFEKYWEEAGDEKDIFCVVFGGDYWLCECS